MVGLVLQLLRAASGTLAAGALAKGVDVSTNGHGHELVTYFAWYGAAAVFVIATVVLSIAIYKRHGESPEAPDPCAERLKRVEANANHLANYLGNFDNWWWALQNDELPDGHPMPRAKAMEELIFRFTRFFSAAWLYEDHCREHQPHDEVVEWLREIYGPFGKPKNGSSDDRIMSQELHAIGEAGTNDWGTAQVRLKSEAEVKNAIDDNVFDPLRRFLNGAGPDTEVLARLEIVREVLKRGGKAKSCAKLMTAQSSSGDLFQRVRQWRLARSLSK